MSSMTCCGKARTHSSISLGERRNDAGDHLSNFSEYSRTAASPRAAMSARIVSTVLRTCALFSAFASADWPVLRWRIMACSRYPFMLRTQDFRTTHFSNRAVYAHPGSFGLGRWLLLLPPQQNLWADSGSGS